MKKYFLVLLLTPFLFGMLLAQPAPRAPRDGDPDSRQKERVEAFKIGFMTRELALTPEESKRFWPVYDEMQEKEAELRKQYQPGKPVRDMTNQEASAQFERKMALLDAEHDLQRQYLLRLKEVLPLQKVLLLPQVEREFKRKLMQEMRQRRQGKRQE